MFLTLKRTSFMQGQGNDSYTYVSLGLGLSLIWALAVAESSSSVKSHSSLVCQPCTRRPESTLVTSAAQFLWAVCAGG